MTTTSPQSATQARFPGKRTATDGSGAIVDMETAGSDAAGAYPILSLIHI